MIMDVSPRGNICGGRAVYTPGPPSPGPARPQSLGYAGAARPQPLYGAYPAPNPGSLFPRRKSDQNAAGDTPDPALVQSDAPKFCYPVATECLFCLRLVVIGLVVILLRLSPLVLIGTSSRAEQIDSSVPSKGRQAKLDKQPATDQKPGGFSDSVAEHYQSLMETD